MAVTRVVPRESSLSSLSGTGGFYVFLEVQETVDYSKTLNLPETQFPMRGNLPQREPEIIDFWQKNDIDKKRVARRAAFPQRQQFGGAQNAHDKHSAITRVP